MEGWDSMGEANLLRLLHRLASPERRSQPRLFAHVIRKRHRVSEDLSPYHAELAVASGKPTSGLPVRSA